MSLLPITPRSSRGAPARNLDARCLYLYSRYIQQGTSTGEALVFSSRDGTERRFPIARLVRIVCSHTIDWSGSALMLCQQRGVTITWLDHQGRPQGHLLPYREGSRDLAETLELLGAEVPTWSEQFQNWLRQQRQRVLKIWASEREQAGKSVGRLEWNAAVQRIVYLGSVIKLLPTEMHGMVAALVIQRLCDMGLQYDYPCCQDEPVMLANELTWLLWARMNLCAGSIAHAIAHPREAADVFERSIADLERQIQNHLGSLRVLAQRALRGR